MGACERCFNDSCIGAPCHLECKYVGGTCETIFLGFGGDEGLMAMEKKEEFHDWKMKAQIGAYVREGELTGHVITHINGEQVSAIDDFESVFAALKDGDKLITLRPENLTRWLITLPDEFEEIFEREKK